MIPEMLQDALVEELKKILSDRNYKSPAGELIPINIYAQSTPIPESDDDADPAPYIVVRLLSGEDDGKYDSNYEVMVLLAIGVYDDGLAAQGHRHILNIVNRVYERFQTNPCLDNRYIYQGGFQWVIEDEDYYPYWFGAVKMTFNIPALRREDKFA